MYNMVETKASVRVVKILPPGNFSIDGNNSHKYAIMINELYERAWDLAISDVACLAFLKLFLIFHHIPGFTAV